MTVLKAETETALETDDGLKAETERLGFAVVPSATTRSHWGLVSVAFGVRSVGGAPLPRGSTDSRQNCGVRRSPVS